MHTDFLHQHFMHVHVKERGQLAIHDCAMLNEFCLCIYSLHKNLIKNIYIILCNSGQKLIKQMPPRRVELECEANRA